MQHRPRRDGAAGHPMTLITAASLRAGSCLSLARAGLPPEHGDTWASHGNPWGLKGCLEVPAEYSWSGEAALVEGLSIPLHSLVLPG